VSEHPQLPGASRIRKGPLDVLVLSEEDVVAALDGRELLAALADGFAATARGEVQSPPRPEITVPGKGFLLSMPAWHTGGLIGVKQVSVFDGNLALGLPNHLALITLYEPETGKPVCVMDGTHITGARTAGAAIVSTDVLARRDARVATIVGAGVQGRPADHVEAGHVRLPVRIGHRHPDGPAHPGAGGAHRGHAEHDVPVTAGQAVVQGRQQGSTADGGHRYRADMLAVDVDLDECAHGYLLHGLVARQALQQRPVDLRLGPGGAVGGEVGLERRAVQRG